MNTQTPRDARTAEVGPAPPVGRRNLRAADWLYRSKAASVIWLVARLWLGYSWLNAGYQKLWGSEKAAFWNGGGAGVKGFATAGVAGSKAGKGRGVLRLVRVVPTRLRHPQRTLDRQGRDD
jgi:hypothetical protein